MLMKNHFGEFLQPSRKLGQANDFYRSDFKWHLPWVLGGIVVGGLLGWQAHKIIVTRSNPVPQEKEEQNPGIPIKFKKGHQAKIKAKKARNPQESSVKDLGVLAGGNIYCFSCAEEVNIPKGIRKIVKSPISHSDWDKDCSGFCGRSLRLASDEDK